MITTTLQTFAQVPVAQELVAQGNGLGTGGLRQWILDNVVPLLLLSVALLLLWLGGGKGDNAGVGHYRSRRVGRRRKSGYLAGQSPVWVIARADSHR